MKECFSFSLLGERREGKAVAWGKFLLTHFTKKNQNRKQEKQQNFAATETQTHSGPAAVQCYCCPEPSEHVLRCDWQVLASSCSYRFLLALLLLLLCPTTPASLPPSPVLLTNHNWQETNRTLSAPMERVVSPVSVEERAESRWGEDWRENQASGCSSSRSLGKIQPKACSRDSRVECSLAPMDSFHTFKTLLWNRRKMAKVGQTPGACF